MYKTWLPEEQVLGCGCMHDIFTGVLYTISFGGREFLFDDQVNARLVFVVQVNVRV